MEQQLDFDEKEQAFALMRSLDAMRKENKECDLVIKVGKQELSVHRNVMRARSDYFDAMFSHDTLENQSGVVEMKGMKFEPVKKCVDFFYTGKISTSEENCEELLYTAKLMLMKPICDKVATFLQSHLNPKSFFDIRKIAANFDLENLNKVCDEFALENLDLIVREEEFNHLEMGYVSQLMESKTSSDPHIEDSKLATILQWIKADVENRRHHLISLVSVLDLGKISPGTIKYVAENEPIFHQSVESMKILILAGSDRSNLESKPLEISFSSPPPSNAILFFDLTTKSLEAYRPGTGSSNKVYSLHEDMLSSTEYYISVVVKKSLYVLMYDKKVFCLDLADQKRGWIRVKDMLKGHDTRLNAAVVDDYIYVGGENSVERYSIEKNHWKEIRCDGVKCYRCTFVGYHGDLYCLGGYFKNTLKDANKLSHSSLKWSAVEPMHHERRDAAAAVFKDKIYVVGGWNSENLSDCECFDDTTNTWTLLSLQLNKPRCAFGLCVVEGKLYAVGNSDATNMVEEYDGEQNSWRIVVDERETKKIMGRATVEAFLP